MLKNVLRSPRKVPVIRVGFEWNLNFLDKFLRKYSQIEFYENQSSGRQAVPNVRTDDKHD